MVFFQSAVVQSTPEKQVIEQKVDKIEPQQEATDLFGETIDTEPEDLFAPMKMPPKKLPEVKKEISTNLPDDKAVKEPSLPNVRYLLELNKSTLMPRDTHHPLRSNAVVTGRCISHDFCQWRHVKEHWRPKCHLHVLLQIS